MSPSRFDVVYKEYYIYVTRLARYLSQRDRDLADDLRQEAWFALSQVPESRQTESRYLVTTIVRAMHRWLARERAHQIITLEHRLRRADQARRRAFQLRRHTPRTQLGPDHTDPSRRDPDLS